MKGRIIEFRGPLGYKGRELYGIEVQLSYPMYIELPRDEFFYLDDGNDPDHPYPPTQE